MIHSTMFLLLIKTYVFCEDHSIFKDTYIFFVFVNLDLAELCYRQEKMTETTTKLGIGDRFLL